MASSVIIMCYLVKMWLTDQYQEILDYLGF
jgi:hypothetical protein